MARPRHLRNAPIAEAVIDCRVQPRENLPAEFLASAAESLKERYPKIERLESVAARIGVKEGRPIPPDTTYAQLGVLFKTADEKNVVQFRTDGFTFNRLPPYTSWEEVFPEAMELFERYRRVADPVKVTRVAARYINRLRFPLPVDLATFLVAPPTIPEALPQALQGYLSRAVLADSETNNSVIVTQALERSADVDHVVVLLDVDAYRDVSVEPHDEQIPMILGTLHDLKNRVFFGSITERAAEMYE
jgi:uncharacterized protein (TIGR04255 family)